MPRKTARYVQSLPILEWTDDAYSRDIGVVTVVKGGNLVVGPNTFHWSTPLDLTYQGCTIKRADGSMHVTMTTADGEAYYLRYDVAKSCWYRDSEYDQVILCDWWHAPGLWEEVQAGGWVLGVLFYFVKKALDFCLALSLRTFSLHFCVASRS